MTQHAPVGEHRREIVEREHRMHARERPAGMGVDAADQGVRMRTAHERRVQEPRDADVVDEPPLADQQRAILKPGNARSDQSTH
jgi:hypothetical protein